MESGTPAEGTPSPNEASGSEADDLVSSLNEWLGVLDGVLSREISPEHREQLERGTAELKGIVKGIVNDQAAQRES